ncbi:MAG: hypothetical protein HDT21_14560 [Ruminococcus sp.]|nr:hypothetical protein [Ruminococcus sp.]
MSAPPRNDCRHSSPLSPFRTKGDFALCGARPKGSALWTSASWAQLDQLESAASPPKICYMVRKIKIYLPKLISMILAKKCCSRGESVL